MPGPLLMLMDKRAVFPSLRDARSPRAVKRIAVMLGASLLALPIALAFVPWQQTVKGTGRVVNFDPLGRPQRIEASVSGVVRDVWVVEGSKVKEGDKLLQIVDNDPRQLERLNQQEKAAQDKVEAAKRIIDAQREVVVALTEAKQLAIAGANDQLKLAIDKVQAAAKSVDANLATLEQTDKMLKRQRQLQAQGLTSAQNVENAELSYNKANADLEKGKADWSGARNDESSKRQYVGVVSKEADSKIQAANASLNKGISDQAAAESDLAKISIEVARQRAQTVTAPRNGTVQRLLANQGGEQVKVGDPLLVFVPELTDNAAISSDSNRPSHAVELLVDGNDFPLIEVGRKVRLQFEGWPAVQFTGWPSVAYGTFGGTVAVMDPSDTGGNKFRLIVLPDGNDRDWPSDQFLRQGVRTNGWVLLNQVKLGFELWRQFNGFPPVVNTKEPLESEKFLIRPGK